MLPGRNVQFLGGLPLSGGPGERDSSDMSSVPAPFPSPQHQLAGVLAPEAGDCLQEASSASDCHYLSDLHRCGKQSATMLTSRPCFTTCLFHPAGSWHLLWSLGSLSLAPAPTSDGGQGWGQGCGSPGKCSASWWGLSHPLEASHTFLGTRLSEWKEKK